MAAIAYALASATSSFKEGLFALQGKVEATPQTFACLLRVESNSCHSFLFLASEPQIVHSQLCGIHAPSKNGKMPP